MNFIGKIICKITKKHLRGVRTGVSSGKGTQYQCLRCNAVWNRKERVKK